MSADPLFSCTQCGDCCKGYGGTYLTDSDVAAIARHVGVSDDRFRRSYCMPSGRRLVLAQRPDGYCIFWNGNCTIHAIKPTMCRKWPFIESVLADASNWRIMAGVCPGMDGEAEDRNVLAYVRSQMEPNPCDD